VVKRDTRSIWAIKQFQPVQSDIAKAQVVEVNTNEALELLRAEAVVTKSWKVGNRNTEAYFHGGTNYLWIAGVTSAKPDDDYPSRIHERSEAERAESNNPTNV
jgi:hypothetical protein